MYIYYIEKEIEKFLLSLQSNTNNRENEKLFNDVWICKMRREIGEKKSSSWLMKHKKGNRSD